MEGQGARAKRSCRKDTNPAEDFVLPPPQAPEKIDQMTDAEFNAAKEKDWAAGDGNNNDIQRMVGNMMHEMQQDMIGQLRGMITDIIRTGNPDRNVPGRFQRNRFRDTSSDDEFASDRSVCSRASAN